MVEFRVLGIVQDVAVLQEHGRIGRVLEHAQIGHAMLVLVARRRLHDDRLRQRIVRQRRRAAGTAALLRRCRRRRGGSGRSASSRSRSRRGHRGRRLEDIGHGIVERHRRHAAGALRTRPKRGLTAVVLRPVAFVVQRIVLDVGDDLAVLMVQIGVVVVVRRTAAARAAGGRVQRLLLVRLLLLLDVMQ